MVPAFIFGVMLVLAQMTTFRGEEAVGLLDIALVASAFLAAAASLGLTSPVIGESRRQKRPVVTAFSSPLAGYAILSALLITVSYVLNAQRPAASAEDLATASVAFYTISGLILCMAIVLYSDTGRAMVAGFVTASLALGLVYTFGVVTNNESMLYFSTRFKGFSLNPNQTALLSLGTIVALLASLKHSAAKSRFVRLAVYFSLPLTSIYGVATFSDAFFLSLPIVLAMAGFLVIDYAKMRLWAVVLAAIVLFIGFLLLLAIFVPSVFGLLGVTFQNQLGTGSQDTDRQLLWQNGIIAWSYSPWFGNGAGGWSGHGGPFQGQEAHNSIIDWMSIAGIAGLLPIGIFLTGLFRLTRNLRLFCLLGFFALLVFTMFHFTFRLPVFWFTLAMLLIPFDKENAVEQQHGLNLTYTPTQS